MDEEGKKVVTVWGEEGEKREAANDAGKQVTRWKLLRVER